MTNLHDEIRQLEQDLENLERRYAMLEWVASWQRALSAILVFVVVGGLIASSVGGFLSGNYNLAIVPLFILLIIILLLIALLSWTAQRDPNVRWRWIDMVGWDPPGFFGFRYFGHSHWDSIKRTEAEAVEEMIEERKARLSVLRGKRK